MPKGSRIAVKASGGRKKTVFKPASSVQEANDFAKQEFGIRLDTTAFGITAANAVNEALFKAKQEFGMDAFSLIHHIGKCRQGTPSGVQGYYSPMTHGLALRHIKSRTPLQRWQQIAQQEKKAGDWSSANPLHTIYHELGHGIDATLSRQKKNAIYDIMQDDLKSIAQNRAKGIKDGKWNRLSRYGYTSRAEFVAECVAEYMDGNPRATAKAVVAVIKG